jgi:hypothetical protein
VFSLVRRADNLLYRRRTSLQAILYSSVPGNLGPAFLLSSSSTDLGFFFRKDDGFAGEDKVGGPTEFRNGKLLLVLPLLIRRFSCASALHIENFSKDVDQEPYFLTQ